MSFRKEKKFRLTINEFYLMKNLLIENGMTKLYRTRKVNSIYFDNLSYDMFNQSEEGVVPRKKIRIRSYPKFNNKYFLEIKISSVEGRFKKSNEISDIQFLELIKNGKPLTITDPAMSRFMMSLEDSVNLVLYAFKHANQGDIFIQKAPAATIGDIAKVMNEIFRKNSKIQIIGTRHGEKLFETLISREEMIRAKDLKKHYYDLVVILVAHKNFINSSKKIKLLVKKNGIIYDFKNIYKTNSIKLLGMSKHMYGARTSD